MDTSIEYLSLSLIIMAQSDYSAVIFHDTEISLSRSWNEMYCRWATICDITLFSFHLFINHLSSCLWYMFVCCWLFFTTIYLVNYVEKFLIITHSLGWYISLDSAISEKLHAINAGSIQTHSLAHWLLHAEHIEHRVEWRGKREKSKLTE